MTGDVSASEYYYNIIQYGDILWSIGQAADQYDDIDIHGSVSLSPSAHVMSAHVNFEGEPTTVYADEGDPINLGLKVRSGHTGFHGLKYDIGARRQVCSNGMMGFVSDLHFEQTHGEEFQPGLAYNAVDAVIESPDVVEKRIEDAQNRELLNRDEALLVLLELGLDRYFENPVPDLVNALQEEVDDPEAPTLYETYNAATRALTHYTRDVPEYELDHGFEAAAELLETGWGDVPAADSLAGEVLEARSNQFIEGDAEQYWDGERETLQELMDVRA